MPTSSSSSHCYASNGGGGGALKSFCSGHCHIGPNRAVGTNGCDLSCLQISKDLYRAITYLNLHASFENIV